MNRSAALFLIAIQMFSVIGCLSNTIVSSDTCNNPPDVVEWGGKTYQLKEKNTRIEPGMKFGWITCVNGALKLAYENSTPDTITVYSAEPHPNNEIILIGDWGRVLYAPTKF
ncbi:hypothetical protein ACVNS2_19520 [Paenibacillus caseinilyticus]|uniref:hypothetical protein n=1 Tax=Paenibacillus mucilaginosus TaxID=61624 RepID=UPI000FFF32E0|nr:hypothetical protein [Paenibacillus mucilaginosus]